MDSLSRCYFVPGVPVWEKHICGKNTLPEKEREVDVADEYKY